MRGAELDTLSAVRREIAQRVGPSRYEIWFGPTTDLVLNGSTAVVGVPNQFFRRWLSKHFQDVVVGAIRSVTGRNFTVRFEVRPCNDQQSRSTSQTSGSAMPCRESKQPQSSPAVRSLPPRIAKGAEHWAAMDDFVIGTCNELAATAARQACRPPAPWRVLLLHGGVGLGKTHLLQAVCRNLAGADQPQRVIYLTAEEFTSDFITALRGGGMPSFRKRYRGLDALAIDDIQFLARKQATQEEFLHTLDHLATQGRLVLLAADRPAHLLPFGSDALLTRLQAGMSCNLQSPDEATRRAIVSAKARRAQLVLPDDVCKFVADSFTAGVRELEGAINALRAHQELLGACLDLQYAQRVLAELVRPAKAVLLLKDVERAVCNVFGIEPTVLHSPVRQRRVSQPRMLAMYLARKHTRAAYSEIGAFFGGRNHSTAIAAHKKVDQWVQRRQMLEARNGRWRVGDALAALERELRAS